MKRSIAAICLLLSSSLHAAGLEGFALLGGINWSATTAEVSGTTTNSLSGDLKGVGQQAITGSIGAEYNFSLSDTGLLGIGVMYDPSNRDIATGSFTDGAGYVVTLKADMESLWSVYVAPGFKLNDSTSFYAKVALTSGDVHVVIDNANPAENDHNQTRTFGGLGYGFGMRSLVGDKMFIGVEVMRTNYDTEGYQSLNYGNGTTTGSVLLGITF